MKAKVEVAAYWANCGKCQAELVDPDDGSLLLKTDKNYDLTCPDLPGMWY